MSEKIVNKNNIIGNIFSGQKIYCPIQQIPNVNTTTEKEIAKKNLRLVIDIANRFGNEIFKNFFKNITIDYRYTIGGLVEHHINGNVHYLHSVSLCVTHIDNESACIHNKKHSNILKTDINKDIMISILQKLYIICTTIIMNIYKRKNNVNYYCKNNKNNIYEVKTLSDIHKKIFLDNKNGKNITNIFVYPVRRSKRIAIKKDNLGNNIGKNIIKRRSKRIANKKV